MHNNEDFQAIKPFIYENYQEYRILQPNVIFIHGLPEKYSHLNVPYLIHSRYHHLIIK